MTPDGVVCFLSASVCFFYGLYITHARALKPAAIAHDKGSGYNVIAQSELPSDYKKHVIPNAKLSRLVGATEELLQQSGFVRLYLWLNKNVIHYLCQNKKIAGFLRFGSKKFEDAHVQNHQTRKRKLISSTEAVSQ